MQSTATAQKRIDLTQLKSVKDIPAELVFERIGDTVVTIDGTKVNDTLIAQAKASAEAARNSAAAAGGEGKVSDKEREAIILEAQAAGRQAAREEFARLQDEAVRTKK